MGHRSPFNASGLGSYTPRAGARYGGEKAQTGGGCVPYRTGRRGQFARDDRQGPRPPGGGGGGSARHEGCGGCGGGWQPKGHGRGGGGGGEGTAHSPVPG